jgi:hypothetical protein
MFEGEGIVFTVIAVFVDGPPRGNIPISSRSYTRFAQTLSPHSTTTTTIQRLEHRNYLFSGKLDPNGKFRYKRNPLDMTYSAFGEHVISGQPDLRLTLSPAFSVVLEPAPITSTTAQPYLLLSSTIKAVYNAHRGIEGDNNIIIAPGIMPGNTGTFFPFRL